MGLRMAWRATAIRHKGDDVQQANQDHHVETDIDRIAARSGVGVVLFDSDLRCTWTNGCFSEMLRYAPGELDGRSLVDITHPDDRPRLNERVRQAFSCAANSYTARNRYVAGDGTLIVCDVLVSVSFDDDGQPISGLGVHTLASQINSTTRRIETLQRAAAIGQLTASAVHDIRNSLSSMALIGETLDSRFGPDTGVDLLRREIQTTLGLLGSISTFARPELPLGDDHHDLAFSVSALIEQTTALLEIVIPATTEFTIAIETESAYPDIEPREFQQVILNLVLNARDATSAPGGTISITATPTPGDASQTDIRVSDNGDGMTEHDLERAFDPYFTTKGMAGTGLGLPICREIVERHGGQLFATSQAGMGSTFVIRLPIT